MTESTAAEPRSTDPSSHAAPGAEVSPRWARWRAALPIDEYEARFAQQHPDNRSAHGEADFIRSYEPKRVLDAGCGTGRVAIELHRHGIDVVGTDLDTDMLAAARRKTPEIRWIRADLAVIGTPADAGAGDDPALADPFDIVAMPGNVMLFCRPESRAPIVACLATLIRAGGRLIAGFSLGQGVTLQEYDGLCSNAGLQLEQHFSGWDRAPLGVGDQPTGDYVVTVHTRN